MSTEIGEGERPQEAEQRTGEEEAHQQGSEEATAPLTPKPAGGGQEERTAAPADAAETGEKGKPPRVQSVFSLVRSQIRVQSGLESRRSGMLQLVQRVTRQLDRSKGEQAGSVPDPEAAAPGEEVVTGPEAEGGTVEEEVVVVEKEGESREEVCVALLQEVLHGVESLRTEVREEMRLLRQEAQTHTEQALLALETRLIHSLRAQAAAAPAVALPKLHPALLADVKKHKPLSIPPLGTSRRRTLSRTMTTITAKTCPPPTMGPRSMSEPLGPTEANLHFLPRGADPLGVSLGPLPPTLPPAQQGKRPLRGKTRAGKPAP